VERSACALWLSMIPEYNLFLPLFSPTRLDEVDVMIVQRLSTLKILVSPNQLQSSEVSVP
jgi:hypothetical protein